MVTKIVAELAYSLNKQPYWHFLYELFEFYDFPLLLP